MRLANSRNFFLSNKLAYNQDPNTQYSYKEQ